MFLKDSRSCSLFFFFQAEDGIRDWSVTGVQTCALPISSAASGVRATVVVVTTKTVARTPEAAEADVDRFRRELGVDQLDILLLHCLTDPARSEERRVGKEWRPRCKADDEKQKNDQAQPI